MTDDTPTRSRGDRYALSALRNKRAMIASEIIQLERQLRHRRDILVHVDATLKLLDPSLDVGDIRPKRPPQRIKLFRQGELGRLILGALRRGPKTGMRSRDIVSDLLTQGGHGDSARQTVAGRVRGNLSYLERRGMVRKEGDGREAMWRLLG